MANNFQTTQSGSAELKNNYQQDPAYIALQRRRQKLVEKHNIEDKDINEDANSIRTEFPDED